MSGTINPAKIDDRATLLRRANRVMVDHAAPLLDGTNFDSVKEELERLTPWMAPKHFMTWFDQVVNRYNELGGSS